MEGGREGGAGGGGGQERGNRRGRAGQQTLGINGFEQRSKEGAGLMSRLLFAPSKHRTQNKTLVFPEAAVWRWVLNCAHAVPESVTL